MPWLNICSIGTLCIIMQLQCDMHMYMYVINYMYDALSYICSSKDYCVLKIHCAYTYYVAQLALYYFMLLAYMYTYKWLP